MVNQAKRGFYDNLSRKDLQSMCRLYSLPANRSHSELEKSLVAYLEKGINGSISNLRWASHSKCNGSGINQRKSRRKNSGEKFLSSPNNDMVETMPQSEYIDVGNDKCPAENTLASSFGTSSKVRSSPFEFYVKSEEGINLYVDLNSNPSDWTEKFKNEVCMVENVQYKKSRSLHEDLGYFKEGDREMESSFWNIQSGEIRVEHIDIQSSQSSKMTKDDYFGFDRSKKGETSLIPLAIQPCSASADVSDKSKLDQPHKLSDLNSGVHDNIVSVADSCAKDGCTIVLGSGIIDAHGIKTLPDTAVNSKYSDPSSPDTLEHPNSNLIQCQNVILENDSGFVNPAAICRGCSASSSIEMQSSEVASCNKDASCSHCENGFIGGFDTKDSTETEKIGLANTSELNPDVSGSRLPVPAEEGEKSNILYERESSGSSPFTRSLKKTRFSSDDIETREQRKKKRYSEDKNLTDNAMVNTKILRSMKCRKDLPRRSMRLMSK